MLNTDASRSTQVPIAFIVFNRPDVTRQVFAAIRKARPRTLLVVADGPRPDRAGEEDRVKEVRDIVGQVDWPCDVHRNYASLNMGCKARVSSGLEWVFQVVDAAIILEDDCLPADAFVPFCESLLAKYRDQPKVFAISGANFAGSDEPAGHYFSKYSLMWGWATWADRWQYYRVDPIDYRAVLRRTWGANPLAFLYWRKIFSVLAAGRIDTWDYQWILTVWRQRGLVARPTQNLVTNIGFGLGATHTVDITAQAASTPATRLTEGFERPIGPMRVDARRDKVDSRVWAVIGLRALLLMYFPWLARFRRGA